MGSSGLNIASSFSQSYSNSSNPYNYIRKSGEGKEIENLNDEEKNDEISTIYRINIPAFNDEGVQELYDLFGKIITGSNFRHEALLFITKNGKYYVCQTYRIQFKKVNNYNDGIEEIKSYWSFNKNTKYTERKNINFYNTIKIKDIINVVKGLPDFYDLFTYIEYLMKISPQTKEKSQKIEGTLSIPIQYFILTT